MEIQKALDQIKERVLWKSGPSESDVLRPKKGEKSLFAREVT